MKLLSVATLLAAAATVVFAMPTDQIEAHQLAISSAASAASSEDALLPLPPALEAEFTYEQYVAMPLEERRALVELLLVLEGYAKEGATHEELMTALAENNLTGPWAWLKCKICTKAIGFFVGKVRKYGCGRVAIYSASICEVAGLGPEDPLADLCASAIIAACPIVAKKIAHKVTNPTTLCRAIHWC